MILIGHGDKIKQLKLDECHNIKYDYKKKAILRLIKEFDQHYTEQMVEYYDMLQQIKNKKVKAISNVMHVFLSQWIFQRRTDIELKIVSELVN